MLAVKLKPRAPQENLPVVFIKVGEYHYSAKPSQVKTVLGSCITITMYDPVTSTGAMCHGLLPNCENHGKCDKTYNSCFKFVECSIWAMLREFEYDNIPKSRLEVKMFGGASITKSKVCRSDVFKVGQRNVQAALKAFDEAGLKMSAFDFGGGESRKITFRTDTGLVLLKREGLQEATLF